MKQKYYLTTPIYYVNAAPHIGHTYTTIAADTIRRWKQMQGYDAVLTTGTDEHGQKVQRSALAAGKTPQEFTTVIAEEYQRQWRELGFQIDRFMRTTDPRHRAVVHRLFEACRRNGYIYKGNYTGQYCVYCELYVNDASPASPCPDCKRPTETVTEENYFFKLSAFQQRLLEHYERYPDFIRPESRRNEVISFVQQGLNDLSISRTTIQWGIPVPGEENHVFYVWFDALTTYMSAVDGEHYWPADLHLIGKEILRFHAVYWPCFLWAAGAPLPKQIFAHGWLLFEQDKMSKSRGNIVRPDPIRKVLGTDAMRYFLLREVVFGQDGSFSYDALINRYNADLANGVGNLLSRTLKMIERYREGRIPADTRATGGAVAELAGDVIVRACQALDELEFHKALEAVWSLIGAVDKFLVEEAPWTLAKQPEGQARLDATLYTAAEALRLTALLLAPLLPATAAEIWRQLGMQTPLTEAGVAELRWGGLASGQQLGELQTLFPRVDREKAEAAMREFEAQETVRQAALLGQVVEAPAAEPLPAAEPAPAGEAAPAVKASGRISKDDFAKVDMRVGLVLQAERVKRATKLLQLSVDIGEAQPRTIVAGIAEAYSPEQLIGRKVVIVANLEPLKLHGIVSNGMIVAASREGEPPVLVGFYEDVPVGARLR